MEGIESLGISWVYGKRLGCEVEVVIWVEDDVWFGGIEVVGGVWVVFGWGVVVLMGFEYGDVIFEVVEWWLWW